jgi:hypothetical protein
MRPPRSPRTHTLLFSRALVSKQDTFSVRVRALSVQYGLKFATEKEALLLFYFLFIASVGAVDEQTKNLHCCWGQAKYALPRCELSQRGRKGKFCILIANVLLFAV